MAMHAIHGYTCLYVAILAYTWVYMAIHSNSWSYMALHGNAGGTHGYVCLHMGIQAINGYAMINNQISGINILINLYEYYDTNLLKLNNRPFSDRWLVETMITVFWT